MNQAAMSEDDKEFMHDIASLVGKITGQTPEEVLAEARRRAKAARQRVARNNARYEAALGCMTDKQSLRVDQQVARGYSLNKVLQNRTSLNVAVMLVNRQLWNGAKGRMDTKIMLVYPDGTSSETFEKKISVKQVF